MIKILNFVMV
jgi:hypothetical protein